MSGKGIVNGINKVSEGIEEGDIKKIGIGAAQTIFSTIGSIFKVAKDLTESVPGTNVGDSVSDSGSSDGGSCGGGCGGG